MVGGKWEISPEREMVMMGMEMEVEMMAARRSGGGGVRRRRLEDDGVAMTAQKNRGRGKEWRRSSRRRRRRHGGGGGGGRWTPSPAFLEQPLEREITPFFLQMTARVCGGVSLPLL